MPYQVVDIEVRLPDSTRRASSSFSARKPMAEVTLALDNGRSREIVVPVRVGRILTKDGIPLPQDEEAAFDAIHSLEERVCLTMLTEMLSRRDHATEEARGKLRLYGFRDIEIDAAIVRAQELRFLNDDRFVSYFIDERKRRGWGQRKIELELKRRGIDIESVPGWPDDYFSEEDDLAHARDLLSRRAIPASGAYEKLVRRLISKGFSYRVASQAARERCSF